jgi:methylenetetrahydrofolate dehydrogenase (NADP+)/methenyltetrahydrofolate cyclohydrolase
MIVDGKQIAADILDSVKEAVDASGQTFTMTAVTCAPNFETQNYLGMKKRRAALVGISLNVVELPADATTKQVIECVQTVAAQSDGVVVQLPLPDHIDVDAVLQAVPPEKDPDGFAYGEKRDRLLPPVVGAIDVISHVHSVEWKNKRVVILGKGRLVGLPAARYARKRGAKVRVYDETNLDQSSLKTADIIVSGIGQPAFIATAMLSQGVVVFDAGTSEDGGVLVGDAHADVAEVAALVTPVPGGIGPITIAYLLKNLMLLARQNKKEPLPKR